MKGDINILKWEIFLFAISQSVSVDKFLSFFILEFDYGPRDKLSNRDSWLYIRIQPTLDVTTLL